MKRRWIACIACLISILGLFSLQLYFQAESKEGVLDLSNESLNQIRLNTPITEFEPSKLMIVNDKISNYAHTFEFEQMLISFNSSNHVVHLTSLHPEVETSKGISLGDSLEDVIDQYGEVTEQKEVETYIQKMIYRDHEVELSFYVTNDVVEQIEIHSTH
ncbi:hypothetical protein MKX54_10330 [Alkalihalobacillus sp. FSL R5-0424]